MNIQTVLTDTVAAFASGMPVSELSPDEYAAMRYPKFPTIMRFATRRYAVAGFGSLFTMYTRGMGGLMQLATLVWTPNLGTDVPLLLVDVMAMGKKRAAFVEYYDLTAGNAACEPIVAVAGRYQDLPDYAEKPAWYVEERAPYSLIKGGSDDARLCAMLTDSARAYAAVCAENAVPNPGNRVRLAAFVERMAAEGNPSSATMEKVLGKAEAEAFFRTHIMPVAGAATE